MNKRAGIIGKIFFGIIIFIVLFLIYVGITINQTWNSAKVVINELPKFQEMTREVLISENCSQAENLYTSERVIFDEVDSLCRNMLIRFSASKIKKLPFNCETKENFKDDMHKSLEKFEEICLLGTEKENNLEEFVENISEENLDVTIEEIEDVEDLEIEED